MKRERHLWRRLPAAAVLVTTAVAMAAASTGPAIAAAPEGDVVQTAEHVDGSYIVVLKEGMQATANASAIEQASASLAARYGGSLNDTYTATIHGFSVRGLSEQDAGRLAADPSVRTVYEDGITRGIGSQQNPPSYGMDRVDQRSSSLDQTYNYSNSASDVTAYVIDTGIAPSNPEWEGRASYGYDFIDDDREAQDCHGHGSHTAGTIGSKSYGLAKQVDIVAVRALGCDNAGPDSATVSAMEWVAENGTKPAVVNMSLGMYDVGVGDEQVKSLVDQGFVVVVAAGNSSADACGTSPARVPEAITVAATDRRDNRSSFSNYGSCVDLFAPGSNITSTGINSGSSTMSGTSMASPHVAGAAAMYLQTDPSATPAKVAQELASNATDGVVGNPGSGSPNLLLYTGFIGGDEPGNPDPDPPGDAPEASFTVQCGFNTGCAFDASASTDDTGIASYAWDFGDGNTGTGETTRHDYATAGNHTSTLTVTDNDGNTDSTQRTLQCYDFGTSAYCFPA
ncbi:S8 family serine peptidase [Amycolatopsis palatopharyngis]|uniref:S8 family serine peptidase n=1 Tax=Amycolatopsis palatopharyngis TaxID=187982 RepID=UPI0013BE9AA2|nr:S8 family serine peptidase [Amycolatopsis palatopharyngis]